MKNTYAEELKKLENTRRIKNECYDTTAEIFDKYQILNKLPARAQNEMSTRFYNFVLSTRYAELYNNPNEDACRETINNHAKTAYAYLQAAVDFGFIAEADADEMWSAVLETVNK